MQFEILDEIQHIETIAVGNAIRELPRLKKQYGDGRWRKLKGSAMLRLQSGKVVKAEIHWYEADGIGKREYKIKRLIRN